MFKKSFCAAGIFAICIAGAADASERSAITAEDVSAVQQAWGDGIVKIGKVYSEGGDYREAAEKHIEKFYAYGKGDVLFKPTLATEDQFRGTFDEALSYFVAGKLKEDKGFAIAPYSNVRWENEGTVLGRDIALSMGNYYFTKMDGSEIKVEYSFGMERTDDGDLKIVLHHSSVPFAIK